MAGKVQLSDRLTAIAEMVTEGNRLVGCIYASERAADRGTWYTD